MKTHLNNIAKALLIVILVHSGLLLKAQFTLQAELRPRAEYRHGFKALVPADAKPAFQISQRTRINAGYTFQKLKFGISVQDIRLWGETPQLTAVSNRFMTHQVWAEIGFTTNISLKIGRQELVYDDARIFGNVDWAQQARTHDIALLKYEKKFSLHAGFAFNQQFDQLLTTEYGLTNNYKTMQFIWFNKHIQNINLSLLFLNNGMEFNFAENNEENFKTVFSQTFGTHLNYKTNYFSYYGNAYFSTGKDGEDRDLAAYNFMLGVDYKSNKRFGFGVGWEILSGTSQKETNNSKYTNKSFNPLYGTNHKFNGHMDYFYVGNHLNSVGLSDIFFQVNYKHKKLSAQVTSHFFSSANEILDKTQPNVVMSNYLGNEYDISVNYKINEIAFLTAGYSQMFGTKTLQTLKGGDYSKTNNWAYVMLTLKPIFIP